METTDFEIVLAAVKAKPGMTAREIAVNLRRKGHSRFTSTLANKVLYRLLAASLVTRDSSEDKPKWTASDQWSPIPPESLLSPQVKRPLSVGRLEVKEYLVASTEVKVLLDENSSLNDPYVNVDWVGTHVVASINVKHPFWTLRLEGLKDEALYCMFVAVDAYVQWKVAQLHEPPDAREVQRLRDFALRYCSLVETEQFKTDQRSDA